MELFISHITALKYYRHLRYALNNLTNEVLQESKKFSVPEKLIYENVEDEILSLNKLLLDGKPEFMISSKNCCNKNKHYKLHYTNMSYLKNSFVAISDSLYLPKPELLFYQLSNSLDKEQALLVGYELCGNYSFSENNQEGFIANVEPLTNKTNILKYINKLDKLNNEYKGLSKAKSFANSIYENSNSPQESRACILLCSKRSDGGYGLKGFKLNQKIPLSKEAAQICFQNTIMPDLSNTANKIAIEYDSSEFHDNFEQNQKDKLRINALQHDG